MERILVVVFDNETQAFEGASALRKLQMEGSLAIYDGAVVAKHADGTASVTPYDAFVPGGTLVGTSVGSLIGLLGGPVGVAIGAASGMAIGAIADFANARVGEDFVDDVATSLTPNKVAVIAEVEEYWTTPVDTRMQALGGIVHRRSLTEVQDQVSDEQIAAMKADVAQFKEEMADMQADRKAKLQQKIEQLEARIETQKQKAKAQYEAFKARRKTRQELLKKNAAAAGRALGQLAKTPL
jgi:uncharacterized membrane protein